LDTALGDVDAAFDKIIAFPDSSVKIIKHANPASPPGLSDIIAEFRRFISSLVRRPGR
jgi:AICAR transformylase/IMP cyclohydrolase PurH